MGKAGLTYRNQGRTNTKCLKNTALMANQTVTVSRGGSFPKPVFDKITGYRPQHHPEKYRGQ
ncbi:MAG: hypothetical protein CM1200mP30_24420 [Pseudomonadota bacterium]|nr:MAG: hypothetical protein CM1200mP30_24420 [Pseudomonadota bacterium]